MTTWHKTPLISRQRAWQPAAVCCCLYFLFCWETLSNQSWGGLMNASWDTVILIWSWETEFSLLKKCDFFFCWILVRCVLKKKILCYYSNLSIVSSNLSGHSAQLLKKSNNLGLFLPRSFRNSYFYRKKYNNGSKEKIIKSKENSFHEN